MMGYILAVLGGLVSGIIFFGGLYWTVRKLPNSRNPALLSVLSMLARMIITVVIFYFVIDGKWQYAITVLVSFIAARLLIVSVYTRKKM